MTTYIELVDYFTTTIPTQVPGIKQVTVGADEEELSLQSNAIKYPHLRVDTPDLEYLNDSENPVTRYKLRLALLSPLPQSNATPRKENETLSAMEVLLRQVYNQIVVAADDDLFTLVVGKRASAPVRRWSGDNAFGWQMEVTLDLYTATC